HRERTQMYTVPFRQWPAKRRDSPENAEREQSKFREKPKKAERRDRNDPMPIGDRDVFSPLVENTPPSEPPPTKPGPLSCMREQHLFLIKTNLQGSRAFRADRGGNIQNQLSRKEVGRSQHWVC